MPFFGSSRDDSLPGEPAPQITTVPVTDKQGCHNPKVDDEATVDLVTGLRYDPGSRN